MPELACTVRGVVIVGETHSKRVLDIKRGSVATEPKKQRVVSVGGRSTPLTTTNEPPRTGPCHGSSCTTSGRACTTIVVVLV